MLAALQLSELVMNEGVRVVFLGAHNSGKSTLINALLRHRLLPAFQLPTTSFPVMVELNDRVSTPVLALSSRLRNRAADALARVQAHFPADIVAETADLAGNRHFQEVLKSRGVPWKKGRPVRGLKGASDVLRWCSALGRLFRMSSSDPNQPSATLFPELVVRVPQAWASLPTGTMLVDTPSIDDNLAPRIHRELAVKLCESGAQLVLVEDARHLQTVEREEVRNLAASFANRAPKPVTVTTKNNGPSESSCDPGGGAVQTMAEEALKLGDLRYKLERAASQQEVVELFIAFQLASLHPLREDIRGKLADGLRQDYRTDERVLQTIDQWSRDCGVQCLRDRLTEALGMPRRD